MMNRDMKKIKVGSYVRQYMFDNSFGRVYRYGIVVALDDLDEWGKISIQDVRVMFSPRKDHPVGTQPYAEEISVSKLEVVCE